MLRLDTVYQLAVDQADGFLDDATTALRTSDLFAWWLTGERIAEQTIASTTGLLDGSGEARNTALTSTLGYPRTLFRASSRPVRSSTGC